MTPPVQSDPPATHSPGISCAPSRRATLHLSIASCGRSIRNRFYNLLSPSHLRQAIEKIRELEKTHHLPEERVNVPFQFKGAGHFRSIRPRQSLPEISALYHRALAIQPRRILEIGTAKGGTLYLWTQAATADATLVSLDLPGGLFGGGYPEARIPFYSSFVREKQSLHLLRLDSHAAASLLLVQQLFNAGPIDFLFIDGDHTYEGVRSDYFSYGPLVRPGGLIAMHDILPQPASPETQVHRFWDEIKNTRRTEELINTDRQKGRTIGIGIVHC